MLRMARTMPTRLLAILLICLCIQLAVAQNDVYWFAKRQESSSKPVPTTVEPSSKATRPSETGGSKSTDGADPTTANSDSSRSKSVSVTSSPAKSETRSSSSNGSKSTSATATPASVSAVTSNINGPSETGTFNHSPYNSTLTPDKLPLLPEITPAFAVGGVILMISGVVYTLVGIQNKWLHIFLSAAYLSSVSVTVLIIYVMNPPVSNAIQGAYLVAVVMTGLVLGAAATIFSEMTEGLGCLLGGFCLSMWLLVLKPGGLVTSTSGRSIFIAAFTLVAFLFSFSRYTRDYALIVGMSFGGATAVVLGIDCFSKAGLKEFWVYIWNLNGNLFPLGATTYPLTRGMKVEIAATIVIFLAGIVSQMKLWKVIKEHREQRNAEQLEDERTVEQEEAAVGRQVENANVGDRNQWEAVYGDKEAMKPNTVFSNSDSGVGDMESRSKGARSTAVSVRNSGDEEIEMSKMVPPTLATTPGLVMGTVGQQGGAVTVRVARDIQPSPENDEDHGPVQAPPHRSSHASARSLQRSVTGEGQEEKVWVLDANGEARLERRPSKRNSKQSLNQRGSVAPEIVPLPFKVPAPSEAEHEDDRSSVATFADEEPSRNRNSKRMSGGSALLRRLSKRSQRNSRAFARSEGSSTEDLVVPRAAEMDCDRASSLAATMDGLSEDEEMRSVRSAFEQVPDTVDLPSDGSLRSTDPTTRLDPSTDNIQTRVNSSAEDLPNSKMRPGSEATVATLILGPETQQESNNSRTEPPVRPSLTSSTDPMVTPQIAPQRPISEKAGTDRVEDEGAAPTVVSAVGSKPAAFSRENLPQLSKVVMSYRTNEWAKHLSTADAPEVDELKISDYPVDNEPTMAEVAAPVNIHELQQTVEPSTTTPARPASQASNRGLKSQSKLQSTRNEASNGLQYQEGNISRSGSQTSLQRHLSQQNTNNRILRSTSSPAIPRAIAESSMEEESSTFRDVPNKITSASGQYGSTATLISQRDTMLRSKLSYNGNTSALPSTSRLSLHQSTGPNSEAGSLYNYPYYSASMIMDEDSMPLSARRELIQQSSVYQSYVAPTQQTPTSFDSHQPRRQSAIPPSMVRDQQMASWRASVAQDLQSENVPKNTIERSRSALWQERQVEEQKRAVDAKKRGDRDSAFDERMRRGDMLDAHREALRKMQASANKHA